MIRRCIRARKICTSDELLPNGENMKSCIVLFLIFHFQSGLYSDFLSMVEIHNIMSEGDVHWTDKRGNVLCRTLTGLPFGIVSSRDSSFIHGYF